jgi:hypothetical protein
MEVDGNSRSCHGLRRRDGCWASGRRINERKNECRFLVPAVQESKSRKWHTSSILLKRWGSLKGRSERHRHPTDPSDCPCCLFGFSARDPLGASRTARLVRAQLENAILRIFGRSAKRSQLVNAWPMRRGTVQPVTSPPLSVCEPSRACTYAASKSVRIGRHRH